MGIVEDTRKVLRKSSYLQFLRGLMKPSERSVAVTGVRVCVGVVLRKVGAVQREHFATKKHVSCVWLNFPCLLIPGLFLGFLNLLDKGGSEWALQW